MRRVVIIQARMTSTRLPGKVLRDIAGKTMLECVINRLELCKQVDDLIVATTTNSTDDALIDVIKRTSASLFRGSEDDVLTRYLGAAISHKADVVVRITSDCPLIDPTVVDTVIEQLVNNESKCDQASNMFTRTFPRGLDTEAFFMDTLLRLNRLSTSRQAREHVTIFMKVERPDLFVCKDVCDNENNSDLRWTVDDMADLEFVRKIYSDLKLGSQYVPYKEMLSYVRAHSDLISIDEPGHTWDPVKGNDLRRAAPL